MVKKKNKFPTFENILASSIKDVKRREAVVSRAVGEMGGRPKKIKKTPSSTNKTRLKTVSKKKPNAKKTPIITQAQFKALTEKVKKLKSSRQKKTREPIRLKVFGAEREKLRKTKAAIYKKEAKRDQIYADFQLANRRIQIENKRKQMTKQERKFLLQGQDIRKRIIDKGEFDVKTGERKLRQARRELRGKQLQEARRFAGEAAARVAGKVRASLQKTVVSRRLLKKSKTTLTMDTKPRDEEKILNQPRVFFSSPEAYEKAKMERRRLFFRR